MMGTVSGMLALALLGIEPMPAGPAGDSTPGKPIVCQAKVMTVDSLGWRTALAGDLRSISRQGNTTVWVAPRSVQPALLTMAGDRVALTPALCTEPEATASATVTRTIDYVERLRAVEYQHPIVTLFGKFPALASSGLQIKQSQIEEKFEVCCSGKRLDQGILTRVRLTDSHLAAMHKVTPPVDAKGVEFDFNILTGTASSSVDLCLDLAEYAVDTRMPLFSPLNLVRVATSVPVSVNVVQDEEDPHPVTPAQVDVPEVVAATVEGEWLVGKGEVLVVSFGVHTGADAQGKAVARERVAILDFSAKQLGPVTALGDHAAAPPLPADQMVRICEASGPAPAPIALSTLNMPAVPARSLPEAIDKDGRVIDLPPLPEAYAAADLNMISPGSPEATPQAPLVRSGEPRPMADPQLAQTSFVDAVEWAASTAPTASAAPTVPPAKLGELVETFLRRGMAASPPACCAGDRACPAAEAEARKCALTADLADDAVPPAPAAPAERPKIRTDNQPQDTKAPVVPLELPPTPNGGVPPEKVTAQTTFSAALQNPGTTETRYIPLGKGVSLEIRVRVVGEPKAEAKARYLKELQKLDMGGVKKLLIESNDLRQAGDEWKAFWYHH